MTNKNKLFGVMFSVATLISWSLSAAEENEESVLNVMNSGDGTHDFLTVLHAVMKHNPALKSKRSELNAFQYNIDSAKARRYPTFSLQANNIDENRGTLRLNQPLWAFGKIDTDIETSMATYTAEQWNFKKNQRNLIDQTARVYAKLQGAKLRILVAKNNILEHEKLYDRVHRREKGQLASGADTRLAYSRLLQARWQLQRIIGEQSIAETELTSLTQIHVPSQSPLDEKFLHLPGNDVVVKLAVNNSADVRYKREQLSVVRLNLKKEKVASLPTISLQVEHDLFDDINFSKETRAGIVFESSIEGLGLVSDGRINGAKARVNAADEEFKSTLNDVRRQTEILLINRELQYNLMISNMETVAVVESTMDSFLRQYKTGRKSWIEVLNTQRELTELRFQYVQTNSEWQVVSLQLLTLTGSLDAPVGLEPYNEQ